MELIDRFKAIRDVCGIEFMQKLNECEQKGEPFEFQDWVADKIANVPIIESRPTGKWIATDVGYICTNCEKDVVEYGYKFCPHCGAMMEEEDGVDSN